jgi:tetratricopeptide (TPR) repeat protein
MGTTKQNKPVRLLLLRSLISLMIVTIPIFAQETQESMTEVEFLFDLVAGYFDSGKIAEAEGILRRLGASFPENYDIRLFQGMACCLKGDHESAHMIFLKIENLIEQRKRLRGYTPLGADRDRSMALVSLASQREKFTFTPKNMGLFYFGMGVTSILHDQDFKSSTKKLYSALKNGYDENEVRYLLIYSLINSKDLKKAGKELNKLLKGKKQDEVDYFIQGYLKYRRGAKNEELTSFKKALEINPDLIEAKRNRAVIHYNRGEWKEAIEIWESVIEKMPDDSQSKLNIGRAYFHLGQTDEARAQFDELNITTPVESYSPKKLSLVFIPIDPWIKFNITPQLDYGNLLNYGLNIAKLREMGVKQLLIAAVLNQKALFVLRTEGKVEEAIQILRLADQLDIRVYFIDYNLGQLYLNSGNLKKAKEYALSTLRYRTIFREARDLLGNIYFHEKDYEQAAEEFREVIKISDSDAQGHYNLGCAYWAMNERDKAEEEWKKSMEYDVQVTEGEKYEKITQEGLDLFLIVKKISVAYRTHISLGSLYESKGRLEEAAQEYENAVQREPNNPEAYFELGRLYFNKGIPQKATYYLGKHLNLGGEKQKEAKKMLDSLKYK